ncbi:MAG TPA: hypothetical protein VIK97_18340, partial [Casimicrobiaceae bacterium]
PTSNPNGESTMIRNRKLRHTTAIALMLLGGLLTLLAPPVWMGVFLLALGILLEAIGIAVERGGGA